MTERRKRMMGKVRAWTAVLALAAVGTGASASTAAAVPVKFWGIVPQATPTTDQFQRLKSGGVGSIRIPISWGAVQSEKDGALDWSHVDSLVKGAAQAGIEVLPFVWDAPSWAVARAAVPGSGGTVTAPMTLPVKTGAQRSAWTNFLTLVVSRYGPNGGFWAENPTVPPRPIRTWQIWNEQNFKYFVVRPNPTDYGKLVKISHTTIKSIDGGAKIVLGGMFASPWEARFKSRPPQAYFAPDFLNRMYKTTPGVKGKFNGVALHPYTTIYQYLTPELTKIRAVLKSNHDAGKGLWITELGWSSKPPSGGNSFAKGVQGQARQLKGAFGVLRKNQVKWRLRRIYWFSVDDQTGACNFCDGSGLFGAGFTPKPAWSAFVRFSGGSAG